MMRYAFASNFINTVYSIILLVCLLLKFTNTTTILGTIGPGVYFIGLLANLHVRSHLRGLVPQKRGDGAITDLCRTRVSVVRVTRHDSLHYGSAERVMMDRLDRLHPEIEECRVYLDDEAVFTAAAHKDGETVADGKSVER